MDVNNARAEPAGPGQADPLPTVVTVLVEALRALGDEGRPVAANRLAARAYAALRHTHPGPAQKINGLMHRLARIEDRGQAA